MHGNMNVKFEISLTYFEQPLFFQGQPDEMQQHSDENKHWHFIWTSQIAAI
jgi:hypothetical protein